MGYLKSDIPKNKREKKPPKKITPQYLHNSGLYYLQKFSASSGHFRSIMLKKVKKSCHFHKDQDYESCATLVEELVGKFISAGLLDDELYTHGKVRTMRGRGLSRQVILQKMRAKGVAAESTLQHLSEIDEKNEGNSELQAAIYLTRKKKIGAYCKASEQDIKKNLAIMARAGFSYEIARLALAAKDEDYI